MSRSQQWDSLELQDLDLPYDLITRDISDEPRLVSGSQNAYCTAGGKLIKRYGTIQVDSTVNTTLTSRIDRIWAYETLDSPAVIYLLASAYNTGTSKWGLWYLRFDAGGSPAWTTAGTLRDLDASTRPHEVVISRGLAYVKGYPSSSEKLGTVIFDGTAGSVSTKFWGLLGPTVGAHISGAIPRLNASTGITAAATTFTLTAPTVANLLQWSESFDNAVWTKNTLTITADNTTAPDGTTTADLCTPGGADSYASQGVTCSIGVAYDASVWLKSATGSTISMSLLLIDGVGSTSSAISVTTSWQRFSFTRTALNNGTITFLVGGSNSLIVGENIYAWGAQVEAASSASTYQRTLGPYGLPAVPFNLQLDSELVTVTAFNTGTGVVTVALRGAQGTVPAVHADKTLAIYRDWTASSHPGAVNIFWAYTYAYKSLTGQISNRAPLETNPDLMPSETGPFLNLIPKINIQGHSDTTNVPTIVIYRSTDGGGTYMKLAEITNRGAFPISFSDTNLTSQAGLLDPTPDANLNSQDLAASLTSNSPPPTVLAPLVTGTDTPAASTPIASYAGRLWYGVGNVVFYSANEELNVGIPEESFPTGLYGNFYRFQNAVVNLKETTDALYITTTQGTYQVTGNTRNTFNVRPVLADVGGAAGHPRAITRYGDTVVFLTHDLRVGIIQGSNFRSISDPLNTDFITLINSNSAEIDLKYFADVEKEWIVLTAICPTSTDTRTWIYDIKRSEELKKDFWSPPWNIRASAVVSGRVRESKQQRRLAFFTWTGSTGFLTRIATGATENVGTDAVPAALTTQFPFVARTSLFRVPAGNHVNALRRPGIVPVVYNFVAERTTFSADTDPTTNYYIDDIWTNPIPASVPNAPSISDASRGFKTLVYPVQVKGRRLSVEFKKTDTDLFELQNLILTWESDAGSGL